MKRVLNRESPRSARSWYIGRALIYATSVAVLACGHDSTVTAPAPAAVASVEIAPANVVVQAGGTAQLTATVRDSSGNVLAGHSTSWSTSSGGVASVSATGLVASVSPGQAVITASTAGVSGAATVTVLQSSYSLSVYVSPGILATPGAGIRTFPSGGQIQYQFQLKPGYEHLLVRRDTVTVGGTGFVTMDHDVTISAFADTIVVVSPQDQASLVAPLRDMLTSTDPLPGYFAMQSAAAELYATLPRPEAQRRIAAAFATGFDPAHDGHALRMAFLKVNDSLRTIASVGTIRARRTALRSSKQPDPVPVTFLFSNGIWTSAKSPVMTVANYLGPAIVSAGIPNPRVRPVINNSGLDNGTSASDAWVCLSAVADQANLSLFTRAYEGIRNCLVPIDPLHLVGRLEDLLESAQQFYSPSTAAVTNDARLLANDIRSEYLAGRGIIIVAHSQGNLVTSEALRLLQSEVPRVVDPSCVGVVSLAPPKRVVNGVNVRDMIIRDGFANDILAALPIADPATPSVQNGLSATYRYIPLPFPLNLVLGVELHEVEGSYLGMPETQASTVSAIQDQVGRLMTGCASLVQSQIAVSSNVVTSWTINPGGLTGSGTSASYNVSPDPNGTPYTISAGTLAGRTLDVSNSDGAGTSLLLSPRQSKTFTLTYSTASLPPSIAATPDNLAFAAVAGAALPTSKTVSISNGGQGSLSGLTVGAITYGPGEPGGWLGTANLNSTTAPATLTVRPASTSISAGTYHAVVPVSAVGGVSNSPVGISVTYTVSAAGLLAAASLTAPANGAAGTSTTPTFRWSSVPGANRYWVMIATTPAAFPTDPAATSCGACVTAGYTSATSHTLPAPFPNGLSVGSPPAGALMPGTQYYWEVQGSNNSVTPNTHGQYSGTSSFVTAAPVGAPTIQLDRSTVPFSFTVGGALPGIQTVNVSNGGSGALTGLSISGITYAPTQPTGWLVASLTAQAAPTAVSFVVLPSSLPVGTFSATIQLSSVASGITNSPQTIHVTLAVTTAAAPLTIAAASLPDGAVSSAYSHAVTATGGLLPYTWSVAAGLPPGMSIDQVTGVISGTPTSAGSFSFNVTVHDASTPQQIATRSLALSVASSGQCSPITVQGQINTATTWSAAHSGCAAYIVQGQLVVWAPLTIQPGTIVQFGPNAGITVESSLSAVGTSGAPIRFLGQQATRGYWYGLDFESSSTANQLNYVEVANAGEGGTNAADVIVGAFDRLVLTNSTLHESAGLGLYVGSTATLPGFVANQLQNNSGAGIRLPDDLIGALDPNSDYLTGNGQNYLDAYATSIVTTQTWRITSLPIHLGSGGYVVWAALTVAPGVTIQAGQNSTFQVEGSLSAVGTSGAPVRFLGQQATRGYWYGLDFESSSAANQLSNVEVANGGAGGTNAADVTVGAFDRLALTNSTLHESAGVGLYVGSTATMPGFVANRLQNNSGAAIRLPDDLIGALDPNSDYLTGNGQNYLDAYATSIVTTQTWRITSLPIHLASGGYVVWGALTIAPGVAIQVGQNATFQIEGSLSAVGTAGAPIRLLGQQATRGYWYGLDFESNSAANQLSYVEVADAGAGGANAANVTVGGFDRLNLTNANLHTSANWGLFVSLNATITPQPVAGNGNTFSDNGRGASNVP